ncbi:hypothetical protein ACOME3_001942 [Neoechinorhynchus agilis]
MTRKRYYQILGISSDSTDAEIRRAYRTLALKYHPDKCNSGDAEERFKQLAEAYEVLIDPTRRSAYDRERNYSYNSIVSPRKTFRRFFDKLDADLSLFSDSSESRFCGIERITEWLRSQHTDCDPKADQETVRQKEPLYHELKLSLKELLKGGTKRIVAQRKVYDRSSRSFMIEPKIFIINIKPGWCAGTKIRFVGEGDLISSYGDPLDMVFVVVEEPDPAFSRIGDDLVHSVRLSLLQALCLNEVVVSTIDSKKRRIPISEDEIISPNTVKILKGDGMPRSTAPNSRGDLIVKFQIDFPTSLSKDVKLRIESVIPDEES